MSFTSCDHPGRDKDHRCTVCGREVVSYPHWSQGDEAHKMGTPLEANPYPPESWEWFSWAAGWKDGEIIRRHL